MLRLLPSELNIISGWAESALHRHGIPLPEEDELLKKIKKGGGFTPLAFEEYELEVILIWADESQRSHFSPGTFVLEPEQKLIDKINQYLNR